MDHWVRESKKQKAALGGGPARLATYEGVNLANMTKEVPDECVDTIFYTFCFCCAPTPMPAQRPSPGHSAADDGHARRAAAAAVAA